MYHFFVESNQITEQSIIIIGSDVNHIKNVLRMKIGEQITLSNGSDAQEYLCEISEFTNDQILCTIMHKEIADTELGSKIYLFQGLPKADKMEFIIQKAVELGVYEIIPMSTKRCIVKLDDKKAKSKISRWQQISEAAAKQSKRRIIPKIREVITFEQALEAVSLMDIKLIPYEHAEGMERTKEKLQEIRQEQNIGILIGPEGGFEESEIEKAMCLNIEPITLGKRILRTETAGFTIISWIMLHLEK